MTDSAAHRKMLDLLMQTIEPFQSNEDLSQTLLEKIGDAHLVLIGEASHGTEEFYQTRIEITRQLIQKKGFNAIAIEADWPDVHLIHQFVQGQLFEVNEAQAALANFQRFPTWMWRNTTIPPFLTWLRQYNDLCENEREKVGFYGLDLYSLNASMQAVIRYLSSVDPKAAEHAMHRYDCFNGTHADPQMYGYLIQSGLKKSCVDEVVEQLIELQHRAFDYLKQNGLSAQDNYFFAMQNARLVRDAESYYRAMFASQESSWNIRDQHMADTVNVLLDHLEKRLEKPAKIVIWAHNSHIGDARATEMGDRGEFNLGQLMREQHDSNTYSIGFSTYEGSVTAASHWGETCEQKYVTPALAGSYEALFHQLDEKQFLLELKGHLELERMLSVPRLQRAIGVIYRPETERTSHYYFTHLPYQFDAIIHQDITCSLTPLNDDSNHG